MRRAAILLSNLVVFCSLSCSLNVRQAKLGLNQLPVRTKDGVIISEVNYAEWAPENGVIVTKMGLESVTYRKEGRRKTVGFRKPGGGNEVIRYLGWRSYPEPWGLDHGWAYPHYYDGPTIVEHYAWSSDGSVFLIAACPFGAIFLGESVADLRDSGVVRLLSAGEFEKVAASGNNPCVETHFAGDFPDKR